MDLPFIGRVQDLQFPLSFEAAGRRGGIGRGLCGCWLRSGAVKDLWEGVKGDGERLRKRGFSGAGDGSRL